MKKIIIWAALTFLLEIGGLLILNNFILTNKFDFKTNKMEVQKKDFTKVDAVIDENADDIEVSFDGKYLSYNKDNKLYVQSSSDGKSKAIETDKTEQILCYNWIDKRELIAAVEKIKSKGSYKLQLITYDPERKEKRVIKEICDYNNNIKVEGMTTSVLTNVYYISIFNGNSRNILYRVDRNDAKNIIKLGVAQFDNIKTIPHIDKLIYKNKSNDNFYITVPNDIDYSDDKHKDKDITTKSKNLNLNNSKDLIVLGTDRNDVVYFGEVKDDKISKVVYGNIDENLWKTCEINFDAEAKDFFFNEKSEILVNDNSEHKIKNLTTQKETKYDGEFIAIKDKFIASFDKKRELEYTSLNDD